MFQPHGAKARARHFLPVHADHLSQHREQILPGRFPRRRVTGGAAFLEDGQDPGGGAVEPLAPAVAEGAVEVLVERLQDVVTDFALLHRLYRGRPLGPLQPFQAKHAAGEVLEGAAPVGLQHGRRDPAFQELAPCFRQGAGDPIERSRRIGGVVERADGRRGFSRSSPWTRRRCAPAGAGPRRPAPAAPPVPRAGASGGRRRAGRRACRGCSWEGTGSSGPRPWREPVRAGTTTAPTRVRPNRPATTCNRGARRPSPTAARTAAFLRRSPRASRRSCTPARFPACAGRGPAGTGPRGWCGETRPRSCPRGRGRGTGCPGPPRRPARARRARERASAAPSPGPGPCAGPRRNPAAAPCRRRRPGRPNRRRHRRWRGSRRFRRRPGPS